MTETTHPWPEYIHQSFDSAAMSDVHGRDETFFFGPFTRLLYTLFSIDGPYEIVPWFRSQILKGSQEHIDFVPILVLEVNRLPVFFLEIKPPASLPSETHREVADVQMRHQFLALGQNLAIPSLHGVWAFGTRLAFYEYDSATSILLPGQIVRPETSILTDVVPITRWDCDVLEPEGANRLMGVVYKVKEMSTKVGGYGFPKATVVQSLYLFSSCNEPAWVSCFTAKSHSSQLSSSRRLRKRHFWDNIYIVQALKDFQCADADDKD